MILEIVLFILLSIICYIISAFVHEIGHIIMGLIQGFKFFLLVIGPFGLKRNENDKIVFYIEKNPAFWGGVGGTFPIDYNEDNFNRFGRVLLAGPIVSIIFGLIMLPFANATNMMFLVLLCAMPIGMGIACLIPVPMGAFYSDGGRWLRMRNKDTRNIEAALWNIIEKAGFEQKYINIKIEDVTTLINDKNSRTKYMGHYFAYLHYKEIGDSFKIEEEKIVLKDLATKVSKQISTVYPVN